MKGLIAALGVLITVGVVVVCAVVELLIKLAPLLVLGGGDLDRHQGVAVATQATREPRTHRDTVGVGAPSPGAGVRRRERAADPVGGSGPGCARACDGSSRSGGFVAAGDRPPGPLLCGARPRQRPAH